MPLDKPILRVSSPFNVPSNTMHGDWELSGRQYSYIALLDLAKKRMLGNNSRRFAAAIPARSLETGLAETVFLARDMLPQTQSIAES